MNLHTESVRGDGGRIRFFILRTEGGKEVGKLFLDNHFRAAEGYELSGKKTERDFPVARNLAEIREELSRELRPVL